MPAKEAEPIIDEIEVLIGRCRLRLGMTIVGTVDVVAVAGKSIAVVVAIVRE